jgi:hypothetical protein
MEFDIGIGFSIYTSRKRFLFGWSGWDDITGDVIQRINKRIDENEDCIFSDPVYEWTDGLEAILKCRTVNNEITVNGERMPRDRFWAHVMKLAEKIWNKDNDAVPDGIYTRSGCRRNTAPPSKRLRL